MPSAKSYKFAWAFHRPFQVKEVLETGVEVQPIDRPSQETIRVAFDRVRTCPHKVGDKFWPPRKKAAITADTTVSSEAPPNYV